jgi:hypothetical protein
MLVGLGSGLETENAVNCARTVKIYSAADAATTWCMGLPYSFPALANSFPTLHPDPRFYCVDLRSGGTGGGPSTAQY